MSVCHNCQKEYEYRLIVLEDGTCLHDAEAPNRSGAVLNENINSTFYRRLRLDRETHAKDVLQPYKPDGTINKDFKKVYGDNAYKQKK